MNLAQEMAKRPEPPSDSYAPNWDYWRHNLWSRAQTDAPENFYKWPCVYHTMLVEHWRSIITETEYRYVLRFIDVDKWALILTEDGRNQIHQLYHLLRWQEASGKRIADMRSICEFGGGYGAMALVCHRLGFKGDYYIYDLPEFCLLQQWYLEQNGIKVKHSSEIVPLDVELMIACYSLSETDYAERDEFLDMVHASNHLFLYSNKFEKFDNIDYFQQLDFGGHWQHSHIEHLPPESWYSFGWGDEAKYHD